MPSEYESILMEFYCGKCKAEAGQQCTTKSGAPASSCHEARRLAALEAGKLPMEVQDRRESTPRPRRHKYQTLHIELPSEATEVQLADIGAFVARAMEAGHVPNTKTCDTCREYVSAILDPSHPYG